MYTIIQTIIMGCIITNKNFIITACAGKMRDGNKLIYIIQKFNIHNVPTLM